MQTGCRKQCDEEHEQRRGEGAGKGKREAEAKQSASEEKKKCPLRMRGKRCAKGQMRGKTVGRTVGG